MTAGSGAAPRIAVVGAGVAGTFFALELLRLRPGTRIELFDRDDRTPGAGVVLQQEFVDRISAIHPDVFALPSREWRHWKRITLRVGGEEIESQGHGTVGIGRKALVSRLRRLVTARHGAGLTVRPVTQPPHGFDLVVVADGASSRLRTGFTSAFGTQVTHGRTKFLWLSTPAALPAMFVLKPVEGGQLIAHAYPHSGYESTVVVEADPAVLTAAGFLGRVAEIERKLAAAFADELHGAPVRAHTLPWRSFPTVVNRRWHFGQLVLIGDAAHTVHFSSGSGTSLAMEDGLSLARALAESDDPQEAVAQYSAERGSVLARAQEDGQASQSWFEWLSRQQSTPGYQTAFALRTRRDMNTYGWFRDNDPTFSSRVVRELAGGEGDLTDVDPVDLPLDIGALHIGSRLVFSEHAADDPSTPAFRIGAGTTDSYRGVVLSAHLGAHLPAGNSCAIVHGRHWDEVVDLLRRLRRAPELGAVGVFIETERALAALGNAGDLADFCVVPTETGAGRVVRTALAAEARGRLRLPVLLLPGSALPLDEINTLIAAGRVDLVAAAPSLLRTVRQSERFSSQEAMR